MSVMTIMTMMMMMMIIIRWAWTRDPESLAAGTVIGNMTGPRLVVADLVAGKYSFNLQVRSVKSLDYFFFLWSPFFIENTSQKR